MKKIVSILLMTALLASACAAALMLTTGAEAKSPYTLISTEDELQKLGDDDHFDGCFKLANDITLTKPWKQIDYFEGVLDGDGHKISGLTGSAAMFDTLDINALIKNIVIDNAKLEKTGGNISILAKTNGGMIYNVSIVNSSVTAKVNKDSDKDATDVAGFVYENKGTISHCTFDSTVTGCGDRAAGIAIHNRQGGTIRYCTSKGLIFSNFHVGGIASQNMGGALIESCLNFATIVARESRAGGICSTNKSGSKISNCGNYGYVTSWRFGEANVQAITSGIGICEEATYYMENCFNAGKVVTRSESPVYGSICGKGKTVAECVTNCYSVEGTLFFYKSGMNGQYTNDTAIEAVTTLRESGAVGADGQYDGTVVTSAVFASADMVTKLGTAFKLVQDPNAPIVPADDPEAAPVSPLETVVEEPTEESTTVKSEEATTSGEKATEAPTSAGTGSNGQSTEETNKEEKSGCSGMIGTGLLAIVGLAGISAVIVKKKEN